MKRKILSIFLTLQLLLILPTQAWATEWDPNAGQGSDTGGVTGGTFSMEYQGFRATLFNGTELMYPDNNCVDILFSAPPDDSNNFIYYKPKMAYMSEEYDSRATRLDKSILSIAEIKEMPRPIEWDNSTNSFVANGKAVRAYLMEGKTQSGSIAGGSGGDPFQPKPTPPVDPPTNPTTPLEPPQLSEADMDKCFVIAQKYVFAANAYVTLELNQISSLISWYYRTGKPSTTQATSPSEVERKIHDIYVSAQRGLEGKMSKSMIEFTLLVISEQTYYSLLNYQQQYRDYMVLIGKQSGYSRGTATNVSLTDPNAFIIPLSRSTTAKTSQLPDYIKLSATKSDSSSEAKESNPKMSPFLEACFLEYHPTLLDDIAKADDPILMLEPVVWYRPVNTAGQVAPYYVYGTALNIAEYCLNNSTLLGNENGANMATLTHAALPNSMTLEKPDDVLGLTPAPPSKYYTSRRMLNLE